MNIDILNLSIIASLITFLIGIISTITARSLKDALAKNTLSHKADTLEKSLQHQIELVRSQDVLVRKNTEEILKLQEKQEEFYIRILDYQSNQKDEISDIKMIQGQSTKAIAQLEVTLKGLNELIKKKLLQD